MKRSFFGKTLALASAGALLFAAVACVDGNGLDVEEKPTTYASKSADADKFSWLGDGDNSSSVTAVWDFTQGVFYGLKSATDSETVITITAGTELKPSNSGKGATLTSYGNDTTIKYNSTIERSNLAIGYSSSTNLDALNKGGKGKLVLVTEGQTNILVTGNGSGAAAIGRSVGIVRGESEVTDDLIVSKGSLGQTDEVTLQIEKAPAGTYTIHLNGFLLKSVSVAHDAVITPVGPVARIEVGKSTSATEHAKPSAWWAETDDPIEIALNTDNYIYSAAFDADGNEMNLSVGADGFYSLDEAVATFAGGIAVGHSIGDTATLRVREGNKYKDFEVKVVAGAAADNKLDVTNFVATNGSTFSQDFALHIATANFDVKAGTDITSYVTDSANKIENLKAVVSSVAGGGDIVVTLSGKGAGNDGEQGTVTFTFPVDALVTNTKLDRPSEAVSYEANYTIAPEFKGKTYTLTADDVADLLEDTTKFDANEQTAYTRYTPKATIEDVGSDGFFTIGAKTQVQVTTKAHTSDAGTFTKFFYNGGATNTSGNAARYISFDVTKPVKVTLIASASGDNANRKYLLAENEDSKGTTAAEATVFAQTSGGAKETPEELSLFYLGTESKTLRITWDGNGYIYAVSVQEMN